MSKIAVGVTAVRSNLFIIVMVLTVKRKHLSQGICVKMWVMEVMTVLHHRSPATATSANKRSEKPLIVFLPFFWFYTSQRKPHSWWLDEATHRHSQRPDETQSWVNMWGVPAPPAYLPRVDQSFLFFWKIHVRVWLCLCVCEYDCLFFFFKEAEGFT